MGVIFVAGVHAVGKTTACAHAASTLGIAHYTASGLIKAEKASAIPVQGKSIADVDGNQTLLIHGVEKARSRHQGRIILDGHFTLATLEGRIELIAMDVFRALVVDGVVVYHDEPVAIATRLNQRDGETRRSEVVAEHQEAELKHARMVANELRVPLKLLPAFDSDGLVASIRQWV
ncbi:MAG TPA: ATP-binding protein [Rhodocyclaceae bacterium]|nr:ATP-binding protein [Rhodocyclaceae bacterium]